MRVMRTIMVLGALQQLVACRDPSSNAKGQTTPSAMATSVRAYPSAPTTSATPAFPTLADAHVDAQSAAQLDAGTSKDAGSISSWSGAVAFNGQDVCKPIGHPEEQPFRGPGAMLARGNVLEMVVNVGGSPRLVRKLIPPKSAKVTPVRPPQSFFGARFPRCEVVFGIKPEDDTAYCQGTDRKIRRFGRNAFRSLSENGADNGSELVESRGSEPIAVVRQGPSPLIGYLQSRRTSEGEVLEAWGVWEGEAPFRISEDGASAATLNLYALADGSAIAFYIDSRVAMSPVHARTITYRKGVAPQLGEDAVVFVGGAAEQRAYATLLRAEVDTKGNRALFALASLTRDEKGAGTLLLPLHAPPRVDEKGTWFLHAGAVREAAIQAEASLEGEGPAFARTTVYAPALTPTVKTPASAPSGSPTAVPTPSGSTVPTAVADVAKAEPRVELAKLASDGIFVHLAWMSQPMMATDVQVTRDSEGTYWVLYGDAKKVWLERFACDTSK
jgi:hypothetical protein